MQTIKQPTANQQGAITLLPQQKKVTNQALMPTTQNTTDKKGLQPTMHATNASGGLLGNAAQIAITQPVKPESPALNYQPAVYKNVAGNAPAPTMNTPQTEFAGKEYQSDGFKGVKTDYTSTDYENVAGNAPNPTMNTPQTSFNGKEYQSNGYTGVQGGTDFKYDPRQESLVQNQITGLLDPNNPLMRKAIAQAQSYSASRGLQSSSLGSEVALSSMIDKAMPIAQQDAQTYGQADQTGWQQSFSAGQSNLNREHDASMFDKNAGLQTDLQNSQYDFQNTQANADRIMQAELQELQYKQSLGMLDAQGQQRMQELNAQQQFQNKQANANREQESGMFDKNAGLQTDLQNNQFGFQNTQANADRAMQAELQELQYKQSIGMLDAQGYQRMQELNAQQGFTTDRDNAGREHESGMFDKNAGLQTDLQNNQYSFQNQQANADRAMQAELQELQYKQNLGTLDAQGQQRMQELNAQQNFNAQMADLQYKQQLGVLDYQGQQQLQQMDRNAQLTQKRDELMQSFDLTKMDKSFLQDLEKTKAQWERDDFTFVQNVNANTRLQYQNASAESYNRYLEQVASVYSNPNMTPEQQAAGVARLEQMFKGQVSALQAIYGFTGSVAPGQTAGPGQNDPQVPPEQTINNPANPNTGPIQYPINPPNPNPNPNPNPGGGGGRDKDHQYRQLER